MPRIILKCRYIRHGKEHLSHLVRYIATREGAEPARDTQVHLPVTIRQKHVINEILQTVPEAEESYEYQDYLQDPTMGNASEFISMSIEQNMDLIAKKKNYVDYIAKRPGVEKMGRHGLFTDAGRPVVLSNVQEEVSSHEGNVWTLILSLRREDAERLGYGSVRNWEALLRGRRNQMAEAMKIPPEDLVWYAAFHNEGHHPHVHIIAYSSDPAKGFLTVNGIEQMRAMFAKEIFRQDRYELYQKQTGQRDGLVRASREHMRNLCGLMRMKEYQNIKLEQMMLQLFRNLKKTKGKKVYGYLPPGVRQQVDRIVDELAMDPLVAGYYQAWHGLYLDILHYYTDADPPLPPLSRQKEFKQIRNMVIQEALSLGEVKAEGIEFLICQQDTADKAEDHASWTGACQAAGGMLYGTEETGPGYEAAYQMMEPEAGNVHAMRALAEACLDTGDPEQIQQGILMLERAADMDDPIAMYRLGTYHHQTGSTGQAMEWFEKSATLGNSFAEYRMGKMYQKGEGVEPNPGASLYWLNLSAGHGNKYAQYLLGKTYLFSRESGQDRESGIFWLKESASQGNTNAIYLLEHKDSWTRMEIQSAIIRLYRQLSSIFEGQARGEHGRAREWIDRKRRRKLREKKMAQGIH